MHFSLRRLALWGVVWLCVYAGQARAQSPPDSATARADTVNSTSLDNLNATATGAPSRVISPTIALYFDPLQGTSSDDLVRRALSANGELAAVRLEVTRARARLRQAGLRPNPTVDFEQTTGRLTGSGGESETSIGVALPLEIGGRRRRRIELARGQLEATEAEIANRER
ncbi:MAG: TolC family protein, partial [Acidobacteriota bacterium]|nr:TolC family protein [Acidobacteriota bacterium]